VFVPGKTFLSMEIFVGEDRRLPQRGAAESTALR
jgi:hypothetical protein